MEWQVHLTLLHESRSGNWTSDLLILSPVPDSFGHTLHKYCTFDLFIYFTSTYSSYNNCIYSVNSEQCSTDRSYYNYIRQQTLLSWTACFTTMINVNKCSSLLTCWSAIVVVNLAAQLKQTLAPCDCAQIQIHLENASHPSNAYTAICFGPVKIMAYARVSEFTTRRCKTNMKQTKHIMSLVSTTFCVHLHAQHNVRGSL